MNADTARIFGRLLVCYELLEPRWPDIEAICDSSSQTFVHGDVSGRNIRLRMTEGMPDPLLFDWEWAGRGSPAIDLGRLEKAPTAVYQDTVKNFWPNLRIEDVNILINIGVIFRSIMVLQWKSQELEKYPIDRPLRVMISYHDRLTQAMSAFGWIE